MPGVAVQVGTVIVISDANGNYDRSGLPAGDYHAQEERRLFYVGMTRAKSELFLTSARDLGGKQLWKPSQFVLEALDKPEADEKALKAHPLESLKIFSAESPKEPSSAAGKDVHLPATSIEDYRSCPLKSSANSDGKSCRAKNSAP